VAGTASPYPGEEVYPPEANPVETKAVEPELRIQPPSIGEQVARPWNLEEKLAELSIPGPEPAPEFPAASTEPAEGIKPANPVTEEAAHNG
jgi:hypothetical protein